MTVVEPMPPEIETCAKCKKKAWISTSSAGFKSECTEPLCPINLRCRPPVGEFGPPPDEFYAIEFVREGEE